MERWIFVKAHTLLGLVHQPIACQGRAREATQGAAAASVGAGVALAQHKSPPVTCHHSNLSLELDQEVLPVLESTTFQAVGLVLRKEPLSERRPRSAIKQRLMADSPYAFSTGLVR